MIRFPQGSNAGRHFAAIPRGENEPLIPIQFPAAFVENSLEAAEGDGHGVIVVVAHEVAAIAGVVQAHGKAEGVVVVAITGFDGHVLIGLGAEDEVDAELPAFLGDLGEEVTVLAALVAVGEQGGAFELVEFVGDGDEGGHGLAADAAVIVDAGDFAGVGFAALAEEEHAALHVVEDGAEDVGGARGIGAAVAQLDVGQGAEEIELGAAHVHEDEAQGIGRGGFAGGEDEVFQEGGFSAAGAAANEGVVAAGARAEAEMHGRGSLMADDDAEGVLRQRACGGLALEVGLDAVAEGAELISGEARAEAELFEEPEVLGELRSGIKLGALHLKADGAGGGLLEGG